MARSHPPSGLDNGLINKAGIGEKLTLSNAPSEEAWIEVIHKMDEIYADLVHAQVESEKRHAEIEDAQRFIRSVLSSMTDVLIVCDTNGRIQKTNSALERFVGRDAEQIQGLSLQDFVSADHKSTLDLLLEKAKSGKAVPDCELSLLGPSTEDLVELAVNCAPRYNNKGRVVGIVLIGRPIGELKKAYAELDQAHRKLQQAQQKLIASEKMAALGRLVSGVAHELNNPISFVFGNMHALRRYGDNITLYLTAIDSGADAKVLADMRRTLQIDKILSDLSPLVDGTLEGAERVSDIVKDLRAFSPREGDKAEEFDLIPMLKTATNWVLTAVRGTASVDIKHVGPFFIHARKGYIHQIIVNLVHNAFDVMEGQTEAKVEIDCGSDATENWLTVRDFGPGISAENLPHIFEPFFTTKPVGQGTGMGLYVSYGMAEEQGGALIAANHVDGGAVFTLRLPKVDEQTSE